MGKAVEESDQQPLLLSSSTQNKSEQKIKKVTRFVSPKMSPLKEKGQSTTIKLYFRRWINLAIFSLITMTNACLWITLTSITDIVGTYYSIKAIYVDWLSLAFFVICGCMSFPGVYLMSSFGLRSSILLAALLNAVGSSTRMLGLEPKWFLFVALGQCITAFGTIFALAVPPKLAAVWFSQGERTTATSIATIMNIFGVCVGFLQASVMVTSSSSAKQMRFELFRLLTSQSLFCWSILVLALILVVDTPPSPPSLSEVKKGGCKSNRLAPVTLRRTILDINYLFVSTAYALNFACEVCLSILLNQILKTGYQKEKITDLTIGWLGFTATFSGLPASLIAAFILDKYKNYKSAAVMFLFCSFLCLVWFTITLLKSGNFYFLSSALCLFNVFSCPYFCFGLDHVAEVSFPFPEDLASGMPLIMSNGFSFIMTYVFQIILDNQRLDIVLYSYCGVLSLACVLSLLASPDLKRHHASNLLTEN